MIFCTLARAQKTTTTPAVNETCKYYINYYENSNDDVETKNSILAKHGCLKAFNARSDGRSGKKELNDIDCSEMNTSCTGCINLEHCYFAIANDDSTKCVDRNVEANMTIMKETIGYLDQCHGKSGEATKVSPKFDPNVDNYTAWLNPRYIIWALGVFSLYHSRRIYRNALASLISFLGMLAGNLTIKEIPHWGKIIIFIPKI